MIFKCVCNLKSWKYHLISLLIFVLILILIRFFLLLFLSLVLILLTLIILRLFLFVLFLDLSFLDSLIIVLVGSFLFTHNSLLVFSFHLHESHPHLLECIGPAPALLLTVFSLQWVILIQQTRVVDRWGSVQVVLPRRKHYLILQE